MNEIIDLAQSLIKIPSVSGNKDEIIKVFDKIKEYLSGVDVFINEFDFEEDENAPVLLITTKDNYNINALSLVHIDVVPESEDNQYNPEIIDGKLFGRGSCDMKTQTAIVIENLKYVIDNKLDVNYGVLIVSDEETNSNSIKLFMKKVSDLKVDVLLDVDGGDLNNIIYQYKHPITVKFFYKGKEGHSSRIWNGDNSINGLINALHTIGKNFKDYNNKQEPEDTWISTMAITDFRTDFKANNVIPAYSEAKVSFRLTEEITFDRFKELLDESCSEEGAGYEFIGYSKGLYMEKEDPIISEYKKISEEITGKTVNLTHMHGATDSRFFSDYPNTKDGKTTIIVHSIDGANIHGKGEYCTIDSAMKLSAIHKKFLENL